MLGRERGARRAPAPTQRCGTLGTVEITDPGLRASHSRRHLLALGVAAALTSGCRALSRARSGPLEPPPAPAPAALAEPWPEPLLCAVLDTPDFAGVAPIGAVVGQRPYRRGRIRIEEELLDDRWLVHNYGHGGAGLSLCLGSAEQVRELFATRLAPRARIAVLGAGVVGLTAALELARAGFRVEIHAEHFGAATTSAIAGGQWAPSLVAKGDDAPSRAQYARVLRRSARRFEALVGAGAGVSRCVNYIERGRETGLLDVPADVLPPAVALARLPFAGPPRPGFARSTYLIEPAPFMGYLHRALEGLGVARVEGKFEREGDFIALDVDAFVNCLGVGAGVLFGDVALEPLRGQLLHYPPTGARWLLSHDTGYLCARSDALVAGGSVERDRPGTDPDPTMSLRIRRSHIAFFNGLTGFRELKGGPSGSV